LRAGVGPIGPQDSAEIRHRIGSHRRRASGTGATAWVSAPYEAR
jgi:hypothetical protein